MSAQMIMALRQQAKVLEDRAKSLLDGHAGDLVKRDAERCQWLADEFLALADQAEHLMIVDMHANPSEPS